jgi:hypothetical protein
MRLGWPCSRVCILQDRVRTLESEFTQLRSRVENTSREFALLLDDALEG